MTSQTCVEHPPMNLRAFQVLQDKGPAGMHKLIISISCFDCIRMPYVNNKVFLDLAKADFNLCQSLHQKELEEVIRWNAKCNFQELKFARQKSVECYFSAAATMFEPEMAKARLVWARCCVLTTVLDDYFDVGGTIEELRLFLEAVKR
jgi:hypothetical protein